MKFYIYSTYNKSMVFCSTDIEVVKAFCYIINRRFDDYVVDYVGLDKISFEEWKNLQFIL